MQSLQIESIIGERICNQNIRGDITTLLVSSHSLIVKGIAGLLKNEPRIKLLKYASGRLEMMLRIQENNPSLVIIYNDKNGTENFSSLETLQLAIHEFPSIKILLIINSNDFDLELLALKNGVRGVITENFEQETLWECITTVASGGLWMRRNVMEEFIKEQLFLYKNSRADKPALPSFTRRELEIIQLAVGGKKNREIAENLFICEKTVKHHLTNVFRKLNINTRMQLKGFL